MTPVGGALFAVVAYVLFTWGMAAGLIPIPSRRARRIGSSVLVVVILSFMVAQLAALVLASTSSPSAP
jgi:hypothetical protein